VFQGQGEPFHNYDAVIQAAKVLSHPNGGRISARAITISTVGLVPQIRRYTEEGHKFRLILSLTSALPATRRKLLPVASKFAIEDLAAAMRAYDAKSKGRTTLAWVLMDGVNTGDDEVAAIVEFVAGLNLRFNLIDVNDARPDGYRPPSDSVRKRFMDGLQVLGAPLVRRYSGGSLRHAACGMLASTRWNEEDIPGLSGPEMRGS
jgi:23S rRNA (adenine2503-C2)-methyltransferase